MFLIRKFLDNVTPQKDLNNTICTRGQNYYFRVRTSKIITDRDPYVRDETLFNKLSNAIKNGQEMT